MKDKGGVNMIDSEKLESARAWLEANLLTVAEAAEYAGISVLTVRGAIYSNRLPAVKRRSRVRGVLLQLLQLLKKPCIRLSIRSMTSPENWPVQTLMYKF